MNQKQKTDKNIWLILRDKTKWNQKHFPLKVFICELKATKQPIFLLVGSDSGNNHIRTILKEGAVFDVLEPC